MKCLLSKYLHLKIKNQEQWKIWTTSWKNRLGSIGWQWK